MKNTEFYKVLNKSLINITYDRPNEANMLIDESSLTEYDKNIIKDIVYSISMKFGHT